MSKPSKLTQHTKQPTNADGSWESVTSEKLTELDAKIEAMPRYKYRGPDASGQHTGIIRPRCPDASGTNQEVMAVAKHEGLNPYRPDWYDGLDPLVTPMKSGSGCFRHGPRETLTSLKQEKRRLMQAPARCQCVECNCANYTHLRVCYSCNAGNHYPDNTSSTPTPSRCNRDTSQGPAPQSVSEKSRETSSSGEKTPGSSNNGKRLRVNVNRTSKGAVSFEATVDWEGASIEEALAESDKLVAELEARYPVKE